MNKGTRFFLLIIYVIVAVGCQQVNTHQPTEESGEATLEPTEKVLTNDFFVDYVEGEYPVHINDYFLGYLVINQDNYEFIADENAMITESLKSYFTFIDFPTGGIEYTYSGEINNSITLREIRDSEIIMFITFINPIENSNYETMLIRFDQDHNRLYFHSVFSEIQMWGITKELAP